MPEYRFDEIAICSKEKKKPTEEDKYTYIGLEHLDAGSLTVTRWGSEIAPTGEKLVMHKGDVLFGKRRAYQKKVAIAPFDGIFSAHGMVLRPRENVITSDFFPLFISSDYFLDEAIKISVGSLSPTINWSDLKELKFQIPTIDEQKRLATMIWAAIDTKNAYQKLLSSIDELVKSQFIEMFGDPAENPNRHPMKKLSELGDLNRGVSKERPRNKPELLGGPYPLVQTGEVSAAGLYIDHYENTYSEEGLAQSKMWPKGTLCITIAANIAQTGILCFDACFPDSVCGFISGNEVTQVYMHYWFSFFQKVLEEQAPQVAQRNINLKTLNNLNVMVPSLTDQQAFESFVEQSDKSKFELKQAISRIDDMIKALMQA